MTAFFALVLRDLRLAARVGGGAELGLLFFLIVLSIVPFAAGLIRRYFARIAPAMVWIAALLATLLGLDRLFQADDDDGSLDSLLLSGLPTPLIVLAKALSHWLVTGLPRAIAAPLLGVLLALPNEKILPVMATLLVGTPALTLLGCVGAAVTVGLRRGGLLLSVLILPLAIPILIFGVAAANASPIDPYGFQQPFLFMSAFALLLLVICPLPPPRRCGCSGIEAAEREQRLHMLRRGRFRDDRAPPVIGQHDAPGMQLQSARGGERPVPAIETVARDRKTLRRRMHTQLMGAAGLRLHGEHGKAIASRQHREKGERRRAILAHLHHPAALVIRGAARGWAISPCSGGLPTTVAQ